MGYANQAFPTINAWKPVCAQFLKIGENAADMKVGDIKVDEAALGTRNFNIKKVASTSAVEWQARWVTTATVTALKKAKPDLYADLQPGWHKIVDNKVDYFQPVYNEQLKYGECVLAATAGACSVQTSGEVVESETGFITFDFPTINEWKFIGNCTPVPLKLSDFKVDEATLGTRNFTIKKIAGTSAIEFQARWVTTATVTALKKAKPDLYADLEPGWHKIVDNKVDYAQPVGSTDIAAGEGILAATAGATFVTIPSAL